MTTKASFSSKFIIISLIICRHCMCDEVKINLKLNSIDYDMSEKPCKHVNRHKLRDSGFPIKCTYSDKLCLYVMLERI